MSTATANLENDHVYILRLTDVMEAIIMKPEVKIENVEMVVDLIRNYADGLHHAKEENLLFPQMVQRGFSYDGGPIAVMLHDHTDGRAYVKGIADHIAPYRAGQPGALKMIYRNMDGYVQLLREHINKENNILFRMADNVLTVKEQQDLLAEFTKLETEDEGQSKLPAYVAIIDKLRAEYELI